ncbi:MAG: hypothetical protein FJ147_20895 [Deltaproteobacteria bacterium]|nr:hypothetical protein [Deltaproteobacteria bacterium]
MRVSWSFIVIIATLVGTFIFATPQQSSALSSDQQKALDSAKYAYIQSTRKDGKLGKSAEIWFLHHQGAVWVCSPNTTHRVKRIQAGQTKAKVAIGKPDGPSFNAKGLLVKDEAINKVMFEFFAKKYADGWSSYEKQFKDGLANGSRTLIKYEAE